MFRQPTDQWPVVAKDHAYGFDELQRLGYECGEPCAALKSSLLYDNSSGHFQRQTIS